MLSADLQQEGKLIKVSKGIYRYNPDHNKEVELFDYLQKLKRKHLKEIFIKASYVDEYEKKALGSVQTILSWMTF
ncbi:MAG: hypothetical protein HRU72_06115 [Planctomycetia bacterium]|nr:hypothetical protein [Candidatus Brocadia sp.]QOJ06154.1 MAG: hypothetical protein HRU72_06115 [Planctomycetia bacterium]TVL96284.1 MAG: hypothetical protein CV082_07300 [Candidatus Brocadia sp. BL1]HQU30528.1 hypothetical protein [Candidatus Brocadia sapporoensis]